MAYLQFELIKLREWVRLNRIRHRLDTRDMRPVEIEIPPRQEDEGYKRPRMSAQRFVAESY